MKKLILMVAIIASVVYAGTVIEVPTHNQNIKLWRVLITLPSKNAFDVVAYFIGETGKLPPVKVDKKVIGADGNILAYYIKKIMSKQMAASGYKVVEEKSDFDTPGMTVTEKTATVKIDIEGMEEALKIIKGVK